MLFSLQTTGAVVKQMMSLMNLNGVVMGKELWI